MLKISIDFRNGVAQDINNITMSLEEFSQKLSESEGALFLDLEDSSSIHYLIRIEDIMIMSIEEIGGV